MLICVSIVRIGAESWARGDEVEVAKPGIIPLSRNVWIIPHDCWGSKSWHKKIHIVVRFVFCLSGFDVSVNVVAKSLWQGLYRGLSRQFQLTQRLINNITVSNGNWSFLRLRHHWMVGMTVCECAIAKSPRWPGRWTLVTEVSVHIWSCFFFPVHYLPFVLFFSLRVIVFI